MFNYTMVAPDIRYATLNAKKLAESGSAEINSSPGPSEYGIEDLHRALVEGRRPDGSSLNQYMPRWEISLQDLSDLIDHLKTLP